MIADFGPEPSRLRRGYAPRFTGLHAAYVGTVQSEIDNVAICGRVVNRTTRPDILRV